MSQISLVTNQTIVFNGVKFCCFWIKVLIYHKNTFMGKSFKRKSVLAERTSVWRIIHLDRVHIEPLLPNPAALCVSSDVVYVDDEQRAIFQVTLEKDGVAIRRKSLKLVDYPADVAAIESLAVGGRLVYFVSVKCPSNVGHWFILV